MASFIPEVENMVLDNIEPMILLGGCGSLAMVLYMCCSSRKTETHVFLFTLFETMLVTASTMFYSREVVTMAVMVTGGITMGLWIYALTTKTDHTGIAPHLYSILCVLVFMGLFNMFWASDLLYRIDLYVGTLLFMAYLVVDVQYYIGKRLKEKEVPEDLHIDAAMNVYLDVINIFIRVLHIIAKLRGEDKDGGRVSRYNKKKE